MISVIAPVYNTECYLDCFISSMINQSYSNFELILVCDSPTDSSLQICNYYASIDKRIMVITQTKNMGAANARNTGLANARGEYIMFADSDDWLSEDALESCISLIHETDADIVYSNYIRVINNNKSTKHIPFAKSFYSQKEAIKEHLNLHTLYGYLWGKLFKRNVLNHIRVPEDMSIGEDGVFSYLALQNAKNGVAFNDNPIYYYRIRNDSLSGRGSCFNIRDLDVLKQVFYVRKYTLVPHFEKDLNVFEFILFYNSLKKYNKSNASIQRLFFEEANLLKHGCDLCWIDCFLFAKNPKFRFQALRYKFCNC